MGVGRGIAEMKTGNGGVRGTGRNDDLRVNGRYERTADIALRAQNITGAPFGKSYIKASQKHYDKCWIFIRISRFLFKLITEEL